MWGTCQPVGGRVRGRQFCCGHQGKDMADEIILELEDHVTGDLTYFFFSKQESNLLSRLVIFTVIHN